MPRVRLRRQRSYEFSYGTTLKYRDINYGGHLGNDAIVSLAQEARMDLLRKIGCREKDLGDGKTGIIMIDLAVTYQAEGFVFDEIAIDSHVDEMTEMGFRIFSHFLRAGETLALVEAGFVAFDYGESRTSTVPAIFNQRLAEWVESHPRPTA